VFVKTFCEIPSSAGEPVDDQHAPLVGNSIEHLPGRLFTRVSRLTIRAEVLPDDPGWSRQNMPVPIHTMALLPNWMGRPDTFGGVNYGMQFETSHVTVQGLKILGMPHLERPAGLKSAGSLTAYTPSDSIMAIGPVPVLALTRRAAAASVLKGLSCVPELLSAPALEECVE
jgi:hypothetical protein